MKKKHSDASDREGTMKVPMSMFDTKPQVRTEKKKAKHKRGNADKSFGI